MTISTKDSIDKIINGVALIRKGLNLIRYHLVVALRTDLRRDQTLAVMREPDLHHKYGELNEND